MLIYIASSVDGALVKTKNRTQITLRNSCIPLLACQDPELRTNLVHHNCAKSLVIDVVPGSGMFQCRCGPYQFVRQRLQWRNTRVPETFLHGSFMCCYMAMESSEPAGFSTVTIRNTCRYCGGTSIDTSPRGKLRAFTIC